MMRYKYLGNAFLKALILALLYSCSAFASKKNDVNVQELDVQPRSLSSLIEHFLILKTEPFAESGYRTEFNIGNVDPQLLTRDCGDPVDIKLKRSVMDTESNTLLLKCTAPLWQFYVPVQVRIFGKALIARGNIHKNSVIQSDQLEFKEIQLNKGRYGSYSDISQVTGMRAKRTIRKGSMIKSSLLQPPKLVARGDEVVIVAENSQIAIKMKGVALSSGVLGEQISVENLSSKRIVRAEVVEKGKVSVVL